MQVRKNSMIALMLALPSYSTAALADTRDVEARLKALEAEIAALRKQSEAQPSVKADTKGFHVSSADGAFSLNVAGFAQVDGRYYGGSDTVTNDEFIVRRIRPTIRGQLGDRVGFRFTAEFADSAATLLDGYTDLSLAKTHQLRVGRFKGPVGLERLQSVAAIALPERTFPTELVPQRDLGAQLQGSGRDDAEPGRRARIRRSALLRAVDPTNGFGAERTGIRRRRKHGPEGRRG
jgi:phosphate-selective porin OprO/OprP